MCSYLERTFRDDLGGERVLTNDFVKWFNFLLVRNRRWRYQHVVLLGDALHTAHFSIGSGTRLALEDAIAPADAFAETTNIGTALALFEARRRPVVEGLQEAAEHSLRRFEHMDEDLHLDPLVFAYRLMTRSGRIDHDRLRLRDPAFVARYERLPPAALDR
jgi:anthraniloyl-CoA monooxygenase